MTVTEALKIATPLDNGQARSSGAMTVDATVPVLLPADGLKAPMKPADCHACRAPASDMPTRFGTGRHGSGGGGGGTPPPDPALQPRQPVRTGNDALARISIGPPKSCVASGVINSNSHETSTWA